MFDLYNFFPLFHLPEIDKKADIYIFSLQYIQSMNIDDG